MAATANRPIILNDEFDYEGAVISHEVIKIGKDTDVKTFLRTTVNGQNPNFQFPRCNTLGVKYYRGQNGTDEVEPEKRSWIVSFHLETMDNNEELSSKIIKFFERYADSVCDFCKENIAKLYPDKKQQKKAVKYFEDDMFGKFIRSYETKEDEPRTRYVFNARIYIDKDKPNRPQPFNPTTGKGFHFFRFVNDKKIREHVIKSFDELQALVPSRTYAMPIVNLRLQTIREAGLSAVCNNLVGPTDEEIASVKKNSMTFSGFEVETADDDDDNADEETKNSSDNEVSQKNKNDGGGSGGGGSNDAPDDSSIDSGTDDGNDTDNDDD